MRPRRPVQGAKTRSISFALEGLNVDSGTTKEQAAVIIGGTWTPTGSGQLRTSSSTMAEQAGPVTPYPPSYLPPATHPMPTFSYHLAATAETPEFMWSSVLEEFRCTKCNVPFFIGGPLCPLHNRDTHGVAIRASERHGLGVFALRTIKKGTSLGVYHGELVRSKDLDERYPGALSPFSMDTSTGWHLDAATCRGLLSCLNSPSTDEEANCEFRQIFNEQGKVCVGCFTIAKVKCGEELLVDYGKTYTSHTQIDCSHTTTVGCRPICDAPEYWEIRVVEPEEGEGEHEEEFGGKGKGVK